MNAAVKKPVVKKPAAKKPVAKKPAAKKPAVKKPAVKKPAVKKPAVKKPAVKKPAVKKPAVKKPAIKKPAIKQPAFDPEKVGFVSAENLKLASDIIDKNMAKLASIDTRVLIAKSKLEELQKLFHDQRIEFQEKNTAAAKRAWENARKKMESHNDVLATIRDKKDEAEKALKESKTLHETYESVVNYLEQGKLSAIKEAKKVEIAFMKKLHELEAKMLKKAEEIKKNIQK